ncbi:unnamed protein product [Darwinula stevensoni]|uniref:Plasminogen n=1 Tax=Darwinula stevensoni TaxID=69355 RepID=A0A7R9A0J7_9CRUS|nr:unnamed protein product [Darwinula stevensoni]CAG0885700.1 unnamed protein product [Darwinula stevensoni]
MLESGHYLLLTVFSCLLRNRSVEVPTYFAVFEGQRYGNISEEMNGMDFSDCSISCMKHNESHPCHAFNFKETDGSCQLIRKNQSHLVKSEGYQAYVQFLCLTDYPKIQNAEESFHGWNGAYPAPRGGQVVFKCKHPGGFTDSHKVHVATCASMRPDVWCTTFINKRTTMLCPPPPVYPDCRLSKIGKEYIGTTNVTETGRSCLRWDSEEVASSHDSVEAGFNTLLSFEEHFLNQEPSWHKNFCRNPTKMARPWCFVEDDGVKMEFCHIPLCDDMSKKFFQFRMEGSDVPECKMSQKGGEYVGVKYRTISGFACVPWLDLDGNKVDIMIGVREGSFPDEITESHNFCRNANGNPGGPWCNIKDSQKPNLKWEYCDVPFCDFDDWGGERESGDQYESNLHPMLRDREQHLAVCKNNQKLVRLV